MCSVTRIGNIRKEYTIRSMIENRVREVKRKNESDIPKRVLKTGGWIYD